jgi:hypothetical protein
MSFKLFFNLRLERSSTIYFPLVQVDHELYCPPEMSSLPFLALPSILHASYWESKDVSAFILRQFLRVDEIPCSILTLKNLADQPPLQFQMPLTVWNRRRTRFKVATLFLSFSILIRSFPFPRWPTWQPTIGPMTSLWWMGMSKL